MVIDRRSLVGVLVAGSLTRLTAAKGQSSIPNDGSAVAFAKRFWTEFDSEDFAKIYQDRMSPAFKALNIPGAFVLQMGLLRSQAGGPGVERAYVGLQSISPSTSNLPGRASFVRLRATFPAGYAYEDLYVRWLDGNYVVDYLVRGPAPPSNQ